MADQPTTQKRRPAKRQAALSMRIAPATRDELVQRSAASGRSVTQEADRLLQQALIVEQVMGRTGLRPLIDIMTVFNERGAHRAAELGIDGDWTQDPDCYRTAAIWGAFSRLLANAPEPWDRKLWEIHLTTVFNNHHRRRTEGLGGFVEQPGPVEPIVVELPDWEEKT